MLRLTSPKTRHESPNEGHRQDDQVEDDHPMNVDIAGGGSEDGEILDDLPVSSKRKHSPSSEKQTSPKRTKPDPGTSGVVGVSFRYIKNPNERTACVISVNQGEPIGRLYPAKEGFRIMMFIDAGRYGPPLIALYFSTDSKKDAALNQWDMASNDVGRWAMSDIEYGHAPMNGSDPTISNSKVLDLCNMRDAGCLTYMKFRSWNQTRGFHAKGAFKNESNDIRRSMESMMFPHDRYEVTLWFLAPCHAPGFVKYCLRFFGDSEKHRLHPLQGWKDANGDYFLDTLVLENPKSLTYNGPNHALFRTHRGLVNTQEEQSTAEPPSAARPLEEPLWTAAPDTETSERSPILHTQPTQDQKDNLDDFIPSDLEDSDGSKSESESESHAG